MYVLGRAKEELHQVHELSCGDDDVSMYWQLKDKGILLAENDQLCY